MERWRASGQLEQIASSRGNCAPGAGCREAGWIHKLRYTNSDTHTQIHTLRYTNSDTHTQIHGFIYTNSDTPTQKHTLRNMDS